MLFIFPLLVTLTVALPSGYGENNDGVYEFIPGIGTYKFHSELLTFNEATQKCVAENGHLAIINSDAEYQVCLFFLSTYKLL